MRKIDRKLNLEKVNILTEQRYLQSKGLLKEEMEPKKGDEIVWIAPPKEVARLVRVIPGAKGEYLGRENGEEVVSFSGYNFYTSRGTFEMTHNIRNNQEMNNVSDMINHVKSQGGLQEGSDGFNSVRIVNKNDFDEFIKSNPALGTIYDEDTNKFKIFLYADLVGYFDPKHGRIDYEKDSRFAKVSDEYTWDRNFNENMDKAYGHGPY
jgi:hypothetical protein